jgi:hypothetical protein
VYLYAQYEVAKTLVDKLEDLIKLSKTNSIEFNAIFNSIEFTILREKIAEMFFYCAINFYHNSSKTKSNARKAVELLQWAEFQTLDEDFQALCRKEMHNMKYYDYSGSLYSILAVVFLLILSGLIKSC